MISEIHIPKLGVTQTDITIVELSKKDGDRVGKDEKVAVIETAKVSYEIQAPAAGLIFYLRKVKDKVGIGALLGVVADTEEEFRAFKAGLPAGGVEAVRAVPAEEEDGVGSALVF